MSKRLLQAERMSFVRRTLLEKKEYIGENYKITEDSSQTYLVTCLNKAYCDGYVWMKDAVEAFLIYEREGHPGGDFVWGESLRLRKGN
jgi:hypothetical protein